MKHLIKEAKRMQQLAGIFEGYRSVKDGLNNVFIPDSYIQDIQDLINQTPEDKKTALLVYIAALEDAWRSFDDDVDPRDLDYDNIWHNLDYGNAEMNGEEISYEKAEEVLKTLDSELQQDVWDMFMDGKQEYYSDRASTMEDDDY